MVTTTTRYIARHTPPRHFLRHLIGRSCAAVFLIAFVGFFVWKHFNANPIDHLHYPAQSTARIFERHLYFFEDFKQLSALEERSYTFLFGSRNETLQEAAHAYSELLAYFDSVGHEEEEWNIRNTRVRLIIVLAELGRWDQFIAQLELLGDMPEEALLQNLLYYAYDQTEDDIYMPEIHAAVRMLPTGWSKDYIRSRIFKRASLKELDWAKGKLTTPATFIRHDMANTIIFLIGLMALSFIALLTLRTNTHLRFAMTTSVQEQLWPARQGIRLLLYAATLGVLVFYFTGFSSIILSQPWLMNFCLLFASVPMLLLAQYYLLSPRQHNIVSAFGMNIKPRQLMPFILTCLVVIGVERTGSYAIAWFVSIIDLNPHWAAGISETWLWGKSEDIGFSSTNAIIIAPLVEEIGFRGLLFLSLRSRFDFKTAAVISATLFAIFHMDSLVGVMTAFWSGMVWAYALERSRSLLPGIVSHIAANSMAVYMVLTFYN